MSGPGTAPQSRRRELSLARLPPLTSLRAFVVTARHRSFAGAADELHVTAAAVGQQIRQLEDHLGQPLFHRHRGQLELTPAGTALTPGLTEAFEVALEAISRVIDEAPELSIRVSVPPSFASKWLVPRLDALNEAVPGLRVVVDTSTRLTDFAEEDVDCVVRYGAGPYSGLVSERLFSEAVAPVCSPSFAADWGLDRGPEALADAPVLHEDGPERDPSCPDWHTWLRARKLPGRLVRGGLFLTQSSLVLEAAAAGKGIGLGKLRLAQDDIAQGRLVVPFGAPWPVEFSYHFVAPPHKAGLGPVTQFRAWLRAEAQQLEAAGTLDLAPAQARVA